MYEISLCMIVRDEEDVIGRCLDSVKDIVDEIIIVDTGSIDKTKEIVSKYTDKIYDFKWVEDFSKARNFSFSKATKDYIMWMDADDVIEDKERNKFLELKRNLNPDIDIYMFKYQTDEKTIYNRERLMKRSKNYKWISPIHEVIVPEGNIEYVDITIRHKKEKVKDFNRNIRIFEKMKKDGIQFDDRQEYCYAKELYYLGRIEEAKNAYENYIEKYRNVYSEKRNYLYQAIIELSDCYRQLDDIQKRLQVLFIIIENEIPTSECCCKIGDIFSKKKNYRIAEYWYKNALNNSQKLQEDENGNFDYNEFYPCICLGVCYFWLGDIKKAYEYNEKAGKLKPQDETYLKNREIYQIN